MESLVHASKCGDINAADPTTMGYYVVNYVSYGFTLQEHIANER